MLCQNCGRRSSDTKSFCEYCGAIAADDSPAMAARRPQPVVSKRPAVASRPAPSSATVRRAPSRPARSGSNPIATLIFWGLFAYAGYWFLSDDGRDLRSLVNDVIQQQRQEPQVNQPAPVAPRTPPPSAPQPVTAPSAKPLPQAAPVERRTEPTASRPAAGAASPSAAPNAPPARGSVPALQPATATPADTSIEGLSPAQVIQKLGRPESVVTVNGVTGWSYRDGALVVYFVKDRATLKPAR
jgi:hypothetical protein